MLGIQISRVYMSYFHALGDIPLSRLHDLSGLRNRSAMSGLFLHLLLAFTSDNDSRPGHMILPHGPTGSLHLSSFQLLTRGTHGEELLAVLINLVLWRVVLNAG